jgi:hypothetical protein
MRKTIVGNAFTEYERDKEIAAAQRYLRPSPLSKPFRRTSFHTYISRSGERTPFALASVHPTPHRSGIGFRQVIDPSIK